MTVDEIYELVITNVYDSIPVEDWQIAFLNIEGDDTAMGISGVYVVDNEEFPIDVAEFDPYVEFALMELHEIMTENDTNNWDKAVLTLLPDGAFNIEFESTSESA